MKLLTKITAMFDTIINLLAYLSIGLFIFAWFSVCTEIVMRYFLNHPLVWVVEISEYILVYMTFLGATWLLKKEGHVSIDIVPMFLSPRNDALLNIITSILGAISCLAFAWYAGLVTWDHFQRGIYDLKFLTLPLAPLFAPLCIGSFLLFIQFVRRTNAYMEKWRKTRDKMQAV
jgi:C4-dicarboxylate transporter DctQ subunit